MPLDYYSILGVSKVSSRDAYERAYDRVANSPIEGISYSAEALSQRVSLLQVQAQR